MNREIINIKPGTTMNEISDPVQFGFSHLPLLLWLIDFN
jgi:hypothetical protein